MKKSWRTTLGSLLGALGIGMKHNAQLAPYADVVEMAGIVILGSSARDNGVSSEEAGVKPKTESTP